MEPNGLDPASGKRSEPSLGPLFGDVVVIAVKSRDRLFMDPIEAYLANSRFRELVESRTDRGTPSGR